MARLNTSHPAHVGELPRHETASTVATACGPLGSNRHDLEQLVSQLQALQIDDPHLQTLWQRVLARTWRQMRRGSHAGLRPA